MYKVIRYFEDLEDNRYQYRVGDRFPRAGHNVSDERIAFLQSNKTTHGKPVITKVDTVEKTTVKPAKVEPITEPVVEDATSTIEEPTENVAVEGKRGRGRPRKE